MRLHETALFLCLALLRRSKTWAFNSILLLHYIWLGVIMLSTYKYVFIYFLFLCAFSMSLLILPSFSLEFRSFSANGTEISTLSAALLVDKFIGCHFHNISVDVKENDFRALKPALAFNFFCLARCYISPIQCFSVWKLHWTFIQKDDLHWNQAFFWNLFCCIFSPSLCQQIWVKRRG